VYDPRSPANFRRSPMRPVAARILIPALLLLAGCAREPAPTTPRAAAAQWEEASWSACGSGFIESRMKADPYFAVGAGRHEFDGQMPDWSRAAFDADAPRLRESLAAAGKFDATTLSAPERFERDYLVWVIE